MAFTKSSVFIVITLAYTSSMITTHAQPVDVTVLNPKTLNDAVGNTADEYSNISFVDVAANQDYKSEGKTSSDIGAIGPLYDLADSIIQTSLPGGFPFKWVSKIKDGNIDIGSDWQKLASDYLGYIIALVVGFVFILVFPIVGMCFCCCLCCGRCGGKRTIKATTEAGHEDKCGRWAGLSILSVFAAMALVGSILMFVTNSNLSSSLNDFHDNDVDKIDDTLTFFNSTVQQAEQLILDNFNFTLKVLFRDLDNIGYLLGIPIRDNVLTTTGLNDTYNRIDDLESDAKILYSNLLTLQANRSIAVEKSELFHNFTIEMNKTVEGLANKYNNFSTSVPDRTFVTDFNASQLPIEDFKIQILNATLSQGISSLTAESKQNLNDIPARVQNDTLNQRNDLKKNTNSYTDEILKVITDLKSMKDDVLKGINFDQMKTDAKKYTNTAQEYDKYRWYGGIGLSCVMMITVLLYALGILFGFFGGNASVDPTKRGNLSNAGGNMLIVGAIITFIFGWLMMLVTTIVFAMAAPVEKFGCGAMQDLSIFDQLVDSYNLFGGSGKNGTWLGNIVYSGENVDLKLSEMMQSCKEGRTVYLALKMEEAKVFNLTDVTDYKKRLNIEDELEKSPIDFDSINITTGAMMNFIEMMKNFDSNMDYETYNTTLSVAPVDLSKIFLQRLIDYNQTIVNTMERQEFENVITDFNDNIRIYGTPLESSISDIQEALINIKTATRLPQNNNLTNRCDALETSLRGIEQNLSTNAAKAFNESVKVFEDRLTHILDYFVADMDNAVKNEIGVCLPLWNMYSDVVIYGVCRSTIGALNGWWCAFGWTIFFLTMSICAAVKLSKHFRRMKLLSEEFANNSNGEQYVDKKQEHRFQNKVYHSDMSDNVKSL